jgi:hypothetical protein
LDFVALIGSAAIPLGMAAWPEEAGILQRVMFLIAYTWYLGETWVVLGAPGSDQVGT